MALAPGVRLGPYAIVSALGAGGMGEVCAMLGWWSIEEIVGLLDAADKKAA